MVRSLSVGFFKIHPCSIWTKLLYLPGISSELSVALSLQLTRCQGLTLSKDDMVWTSIYHWIRLSPDSEWIWQEHKRIGDGNSSQSSWEGKHIKIPSVWEARAVSTSKRSFVTYQLFMDTCVIESVVHCSEILLQVGLSSTPHQVTVTLSGQVLKILMKKSLSHTCSGAALTPSEKVPLNAVSKPPKPQLVSGQLWRWMKPCANT